MYVHVYCLIVVETDEGRPLTAKEISFPRLSDDLTSLGLGEVKVDGRVEVKREPGTVPLEGTKGKSAKER